MALDHLGLLAKLEVLLRELKSSCRKAPGKVAGRREVLMVWAIEVHRLYGAALPNLDGEASVTL